MSRTCSARASRRSRRLTALVVAAVAGVGLLAPAAPFTTAAGAAEAGGSAQASDALAFDLPATSELQASPRKAFAHWVPSLPVSLDNAPPASDYYATQYLRPGGEGGKHAAYGGYLRDRPLGRDPIPGPDWRLRDMENEVRQALASGLDGFSVTVYQLPGDPDSQQWENINLMMQAAANVDGGFKILLQPDMSSGVGGRDPGTLALYMSQLARYPSAYRLGDGRLVFSPFLAEAHDAAWWSEFLNIMREKYGAPVAFLPLFLNEQPYENSFAPISYGMSIWGGRSPAQNDPVSTSPWLPIGRVARVHALGQKWMQPISVQDERPRESLFDEAQNTVNLRNTWQIAMRSNADLVQLNTWSDYPEGSPMAPSASHGWSYLDINAYYLTWWKTGTAPPIKRDTIYLTHRKQPWEAHPSYPQTMLMSPRGGSSPARDTVEALTFLTQPGTVNVHVGGNSYTCEVPAGPGVCTVPLSAGDVSAAVLRGGTMTTEVGSPYPVTDNPYVQDLQYAAVSSGRTGTRATDPTPPAPPPTGNSLVRLTPEADTYANEGAPTSAFGWSSSLTSRGRIGATSYLRFALPSAPAGRSLIASSLQVRTNSLPESGSREPHLLRVSSNDWTESTLTWNSRPELGEAVGTIGSNTAPDTAYDIPVDLNVMRGKIGAALTLAITNDGNDDLWLWSSNHPDASFRPQLLLTYR